MSVDIRSVHQPGIVLSRSQYSIVRITVRKFTHVRHRILIILPWSNSIWVLTSHQQSTTVESCGETWDDSVRLAVGSCGERSGRAAEDVAGRGFLERDGVVGVREGVVGYLAGDVAVGGLRVDCEGLGGVAGPDWRALATVIRVSWV
jgi:hypothetical protein